MDGYALQSMNSLQPRPTAPSVEDWDEVLTEEPDGGLLLAIEVIPGSSRDAVVALRWRCAPDRARALPTRRCATC